MRDNRPLKIFKKNMDSSQHPLSLKYRARISRLSQLGLLRLTLALLLLVFSQPIFAQTEEDLQKWSQSTEWRRLLHFSKHVGSPSKSLIDGPGFFFAPNGSTNPYEELKASIRAMGDDSLKVGTFKDHPQCAFPARYWFLKNKVGIKIPDVSCKKLDEFLEIFKNPQTISVVFSSAYPNNPASMFGHTFLKINSKERSDLTDIGINYAAKVADDENPFAFIYFGVMGGYLGQWSTEPYHKKIKEYIQGENRDLWEYELNLTPDETKRFLYHIWEIEMNSYFHYYFFDENCSYQILAALEAIKPEWDITGHTIYVIPGESIKSLFKQPGIVKDIHFRPSIQKQVLQKYRALESKEKKEFLNLISYSNPQEAESPLALETAILYFDFLNINKKGELSSKERNQAMGILSKRASFGKKPELTQRLTPIPIETRPDLGHDSYAFSISQNIRKREDHHGTGGSTNIKIKSAYHDLMNRDLGYKRYSHIDFPGIQLQYDYDLKQLRVDEVIGLNITSLPPINFLSYSPSWKIKSGLYTAQDYGCLSCRHAQLELGIGGASNLFGELNLMYTLVTGRFEAYRGIPRGYRYGPGLDIGVLLNPWDRSKLKLSFENKWDLDQNSRSQTVQYYNLQNSYYLSRNQELRLSLQQIYPKGAPDLRQFDTKIEFIYFFN